MSKLDELTEDHCRTRIPDAETVSGWKIAMIMGGATITLPVFLVGAQLGYELGMARAVFVFFAAGVVLAAMAAAAGVLASKCRLTTWMIIQYSFGRVGAKFVAAFVGFTVLGWYGATVDMFARAVEQMLASVDIVLFSREVYLVIASLMMVAVAMFGFKGLDRLSKPAVPVMVILLVLMVYSSIGAHGLPDTIGSDLTLAQGISAGIGGFIVAVIMFPDMCRYSKSTRDSVIASGVSFSFNIPVVLCLAAVPAIATAESEFLTAILLVGFGTLSLLLLLLATWTTNVYNLYSISLAFASVARSVSQWKLVIVAGVIGTTVALLPILDNFLYFLNFLAIAVPPIGGVYAADFYFRSNDYTAESLDLLPAARPMAFVAWILGSTVGFLANSGIFTLTTVAAIDAITVSVFVYVAWLFLSRRTTSNGTECPKMN